MKDVSEIVIPDARQGLTSAVPNDSSILVSRAACAALAFAATAISVLMAAKTASAVGGDSAERTLWAAFGGTVILAAHWLPALSRRAPLGVRCAAWALWAVCMAYAAYSHSTYFLLTQYEAGLRRSALVQSAKELPHRRHLSLVFADLARLRKEETRLSAARCQECAWLRAQRAELDARALALLAEAEESKREQSAREQVDRRREERRADPVTSALATWFGVTAWLHLVPALLFATILDGLATLLWLLASRPSLPRRGGALVEVTRVTAAHAGPVTAPPVTADAPGIPPAARKAGATEANRDSEPIAGSRATVDVQALSDRAREAVVRGQIRPTVRDIQQYLRCSQASASLVRRTLQPAAN